MIRQICACTKVITPRMMSIVGVWQHPTAQLLNRLARLLSAYSNTSVLEGVALYAAMIIHAQIPHHSSKTLEYIAGLERRFQLWKVGDTPVYSKKEETETSSSCIYPIGNPSQMVILSVSRHFTILMHNGKTKDAIHLLSDQEKRGVLHLNDHPGGKLVRDILISKHSLHKIFTLYKHIPEDHTSASESPKASCNAAAIPSFWAAGPSGLDTRDWRRLCTSLNSAFNNLCYSLFTFTICLCTSLVDPQGLAPFIACRFIALNKKSWSLSYLDK